LHRGAKVQGKVEKLLWEAHKSAAVQPNYAWKTFYGKHIKVRQYSQIKLEKPFEKLAMGRS